MFKTIMNNSTAEIVEKKSKFIANVFYVESVEEAEKYIKEINKKYHDARHNCYAYSIFSKDGNINKFSDDGEPSGTAGAPMLNLLTTKEITNCLIIVTRYFGGILLGTGGLVRAYGDSAKKALDENEIIKKDYGLEVCLITNYQELEKMKYYFRQNKIKIVDIKYSEKINVIIEITEEMLDNLLSKKSELNFNFDEYKIEKEKLIEYVE